MVEEPVIYFKYTYFILLAQYNITLQMRTIIPGINGSVVVSSAVVIYKVIISAVYISRMINRICGDVLAFLYAEVEEEV